MASKQIDWYKMYMDLEKNKPATKKTMEQELMEMWENAAPAKPAPKPKPLMTVDIAIPENLMDLSAMAAPKVSRILIVGDSGTGKTHFIGTMPKPFIADFDRGLATLQGHQTAKGIAYTKDEWGKFKQELEKWRQTARYGAETFALDSLTMASEAAMHHVLKKNGRANAQPTIADWGEAIREVKDALDWISTLPVNVVVTAHNQLEKDEVLGDIQNRPLIFGKDLPARLGIWFDEVYATTVTSTLKEGKTQSEYRLQVRPDARNKMIKSRMNRDGKLFDQYETPDFAHLKTKTTK